MKQKTNFNEKGITIIALIITIILLLILVGVSINLVIKGNLFGSAEKAVDGTNAKAKQEQTRVDELMGKLNSMKDKEANDSHGEEVKISTPDSKVDVFVIPTNEELAIARETVALV